MRTVERAIKEYEATLFRYRQILTYFPDAKINNMGEFISRSVNTAYTDFYFERRYNGLFVCPFSAVSYTYNGQDEIAKIFSIPRSSKLIHLTWQVFNNKRVMRFAKFAVNRKSHNFKTDMLNSCRSEVMKFIKENNEYHLDTKNLEAKLKKLLIFT